MTAGSAAVPGLRVAALVLAGGSSRRMGGANKLLAPLGAGCVVSRAVDAALASRAAPVWVVTGHEAERVAAALAGRAVRLVHNPDHAGGLSRSLRAGLAALESEPADAALVCLGDMPWVTAADLDALVAAFAAAPARPVCLPVHAGRRGNPVLWPARHFAALRALEGDVGGRELLRRLAGEVLEVAAPGAGVLRDVDVPADLAEA